MIGESIGEGLKRIGEHRRLVILLWTWNFLLATAATLPLWAWWSSILNRSLRSEALLAGLNLGVLGELTKYDRSAVWPLVMLGFGGVGLLAFLGNPLAAGGILEVLNVQDGRPLAHRFFRGGGHFYGRFFRLLLFFLVSLAVGAAIVSWLFAPFGNRLDDAGKELALIIYRGVHLLCVLLLTGFLWLALDFARIRVQREGGRSMWRAWLGGIGFVSRHFIHSYTLLIFMLILCAALLGIYILIAAALPTVTSGALWGGLLAQQIIMMVRIGLRIGLYGGEMALYRNLRPAPAAPMSGSSVHVESPGLGEEVSGEFQI